MDERIIQHFSVITEEEKQFLSGDRQIDRTLYMDGSRDVISGDKLLEKGKLMEEKMKDAAQSVIVKLPHTTIRERSHTLHEHEYNTGHGL